MIVQSWSCFRVATLFEKNDFDRKLRCRNKRKIIDERSRFLEGLDEENSPRPKCESRSPLDSTDGTSGPRQGRWDGGCKRGVVGGGGGGAMPLQDRERERGRLRERGRGWTSDAPPPWRCFRRYHTFSAKCEKKVAGKKRSVSVDGRSGSHTVANGDRWGW